MDQARLIRTIVAMRPRLEAEGVAHLALFGSRARGHDFPDSDIDLLVDLAEGGRFSLLDLMGVERMITEATGLAANVLTRRSLTREFKAETQRDAIELF